MLTTKILKNKTCYFYHLCCRAPQFFFKLEILQPFLLLLRPHRAIPRLLNFRSVLYAIPRLLIFKFMTQFKIAKLDTAKYQRWSRGDKARGQGHKKKSKAKNSPSEDRHSQGQGQECSRPRTKDTGTTVLQKKRSSKKFFRRSSIHRRTHDF